MITDEQVREAFDSWCSSPCPQDDEYWELFKINKMVNDNTVESVRFGFKEGYKLASEKYELGMKGACPTCEVVAIKNERLQAENEKLRECVDFYANKLNWYDNTQINGSDQKAIFKDSEDCLIKSINKHIIIGGKRARTLLKELGEK